MRSEGHETTSLKCHARSFYPVSWAGTSAVLILWSGHQLSLGRGRMVVSDLALAFGLMMLGFAIREWRHPAVLFEISSTGILLHASNDGISGSLSILKDLFVPWERIEAMRYIDWRSLRPSKTGMVAGNWPVIALKIRTDGEWPPSGTLRKDFLVKPTGEIYLDAFNGSPNGARLVAQINAIREKAIAVSG